MIRPEDIHRVLHYHQASKHQLDAYAPGPETIDWDDQPSPYRTFDDCEKVPLPLVTTVEQVSFDGLYQAHEHCVASFSLAQLSRFLRLALGISAWKTHGAAKWALRSNPSSGNLHPTECYVLLMGVPDIAPGLYHYLSLDHSLVKLGDINTRAIPAWQHDQVCLLFLSSIAWREAWKYGTRAFRYCQLDIGHALGSLYYAAATQGWRVRPLVGISHRQIDDILGLETIRRSLPDEAEYAELALHISTGRKSSLPAYSDLYPTQRHGVARYLGAKHHYHWPEIDEMFTATATDSVMPEGPAQADVRAPVPVQEMKPAEAVLCQRRSAQAFEPGRYMPLSQFRRILDMTLARPGFLPWYSWTAAPHIDLVIFVHAVENLEPGLYILVRNHSHRASLQQHMRQDFHWTPITAAMPHLPLYRLIGAPARKTMRKLSCLQDIAGDSCIALAMLAEYEDNIHASPASYRHLHWEAGLLGQILYLEAEQAGLRGTGIGCFFDDAVHELLGLRGSKFQDIYHFTIGYPIVDQRLVSLSGYHHLPRQRFGA